MDDLNAAIRSILDDPAKVEQLRSLAQSLGANVDNTAPPQQTEPQSDLSSALQSLSNATQQANQTGNNNTALGSIAQFVGNLNISDKDMNLLRSLKPHFSSARAAKIDSVLKMMQLMRIIPVLTSGSLLGNFTSDGDNR